jgi:hypothetical protein
MITETDDYGDEAANGEAAEHAAQPGALEELIGIGNISGLPARNGAALADGRNTIRQIREKVARFEERPLCGQGPRR